jgi:hypothetical protein
MRKGDSTMPTDPETESPAPAGQTTIAVARQASYKHAGGHGASSDTAAENSSALWTPDKLRQLSSALLLELFRCSFEFEVEEKDREDGPARKRRRRYDKLFMLGVIGSYGFGRVYAEFRDIYHLLEYVPDVGRGHAYVALKDMAVRRIMWRLVHSERALRLYVNPRVESWVLDKRIQDEAWRKKLQAWAALYGTVQHELQFPDMPLPDQTIMQALAEVNLTVAINQVPLGNLVPASPTDNQVPQGNLLRACILTFILIDLLTVQR